MGNGFLVLFGCDAGMQRIWELGAKVVCQTEDGYVASATDYYGCGADEEVFGKFVIVDGIGARRDAVGLLHVCDRCDSTDTRFGYRGEVD